jgi:hypothetical protein
METVMEKQELELIADVIKVGTEFRPLHKKLTSLFTPEVKEQIMKLKTEIFGVQQGDAGRLVAIGEAFGDPKLSFYWDEFCGWNFGVSTRRLNQLLETDEVVAVRNTLKQLHKERVQHRGNGDFNQIKEDALQIVKLGQKALLAQGNAPHPTQAAKDWAMARLKGEDIAHTRSGITDHKDPYEYFEQFREELQTMGDEISAMLIDFKLDILQIREVLRYAEMDAKRTLQQLEVGAAA